MSGVVLTKIYKEPMFDMQEILRYCGCGNDGSEFLPLVNECIEECREKLIYKVCYCEFPVNHGNGETDLSFMTTKSKNLEKNLEDCEKIVLFAATVGFEIDRLIAKYGRISPSKALVFQAIGAERIESLCNAFNDDVKSEFMQQNLYTRPRFSPGYGDFPLEAQRDIFRVLDCPRKVGISLNESLLMSPSKSVTAIIGISSKCGIEKKNSCTECTKTDCKFRSVEK